MGCFWERIVFEAFLGNLLVKLIFLLTKMDSQKICRKIGVDGFFVFSLKVDDQKNPETSSDLSFEYHLYHLESRWLATPMVYHGPLLIHLFGSGDRHLLSRWYSPKTHMTMKNPPFEDVFPIENGDCPMSCSFSGVYICITGYRSPEEAQDGSWHSFLLKGRDDLRLDGRIMQLLRMVSWLVWLSWLVGNPPS